MNKALHKILITGASRGIGHKMALDLKKQGHLVLGTSTSDTGKDNLLNEGIVAFKLNLNSSESIEIFLKDLNDNHSDINVLINNAGITKDNLVLRMKDEDWQDVINTNLTGTFKITRTVLKFMIKERKGRIINLTSTVAVTGNRGQANYSASKSGLEAFTKSLAKEVGSRGITVNSVSPGYIETDMTKSISDKVKKQALDQIPLGRFGSTNEISHLIKFLISDESSYITGQTIHINGGLYM
ncbi:MAG: 3-oxoacyl-[acyl-carrier-protein] reductase [Gammaproteobacteria bacterium]|nr:3-oxoacyl-[acyl-carrier-protein] reductase [Gammaproteobacteria bacterium]|tara:strand:- start:2877 stop:3599 length:723 start_codon:yes stop_codon:yes gene_type:complete